MIRFGAIDDAVGLAAIAERTFRDTFAADNKPADMDAHCASAYVADIQRRELSDPAIHTLLMEDAQRELVAYAQLRSGSPACAPDMTRAIELWRFYVDRPQHGSGVAQRLMEAVKSTAQMKGATTLWLGVWERNRRAQAFYRKTGFVDIGTQEFRVGSDIQIDRVMACALSASGAGHTKVFGSGA